MKIMIEIVPNDGPGQPLLVNVVRVFDTETECGEILLDSNDAPDEKGALWLAVRTLEELVQKGEFNADVLTECEHAYSMDAASASGMYD